MKSHAAAIIEITRGNWVESAHAVDIVVADAEGTLIAAWGETQRLIFPRSSIKAFQALPLVESGAAEAYGFESRHLALACASHNGEQIHVDCVSEMLDRAGITAACLECGAQWPQAPEDQTNPRAAPLPIHNTCSGKHAGFLAFARHTGLATKGYVGLEHPVQREVANVMEKISGHPHRADNHGIDGCSVPTFTLPLHKLAIAFAKFGIGDDPEPLRSCAMIRLRDACVRHPDMVAGANRLCTRLMQVLGRRALVKVGAEGVYTASLPELGIGIAMKAHDGSLRAVELAVSALVAQYLELNERETQAMQPLLRPVVKNCTGMEVGLARIIL